MALNNLGLGFVFTARNLASGTINRVGRDLRGLGNQSRLAGSAMRAGFGIAAAGVVGLVAGLGALSGAMALADASAEFEQGLAAVGAVSRATTAELASLRNAAIEAGIQTQFSPTEAVEGLTSLATAGQTATQATSTLIPVLDLAAGSLGQLGVAQAAEAVVGTLNSYSLGADEAANVTDRLLRITQLTNFQTRDFESGLAKAAANGAVFNQSLNDVLITMGLLRNRNIDASSSATAFREASRRLASDQGAQRAVMEANVEVFDAQTGSMRSVVDITQDLVDATSDMTDEQRNSIVARAFGARGLLAFNAIQSATFTTMRDGVQVTLRGREAVAALREELGNASGTAAEFREQLLDTLAGQRTLLQGTLQTFAVVLGEPFARVFKPFVANLVEGLNVLLRFFNELPEAVKTGIAGFIVATAVTTALGGAFALVVGLLVVIAPFLKAIAIAAASLLVLLAPVIAAFGAIIAGVVAMRRMITLNIGGLGDFLTRTFERVRLFFRALVMLFQQGGFSGELREELRRAENQGLRRFVVNLGRIVFRIRQFVRGIREGFSAGLQVIAPAVSRMIGAFERLGRALGFVGSEGAEAAAGIPSRDFVEVGARIGNFFARVVELVVNALTLAADFFTGFVGGFQQMVTFLAPIFQAVRRDFAGLGEEITALFTELGIFSDNGENNMISFGRVAGQVVGAIVGAFASLLGFVVFVARHLVAAFRWLRNAWQDAVDAMQRFALRLVITVLNVVDRVRNGIDELLSGLGRLASAIPPSLRTEVATSLINAGSSADDRIAGRAGNQQAREGVFNRFVQNQAARRSAAEEEAASRAGANEEVARGVAAAIEGQRLREAKAREEERRRPIVLQVDGERIATAVAEGDRRRAAGSFVPVPTENG